MLARVYTVDAAGLDLPRENFSPRAADLFYSQWARIEDKEILGLLESKRDAIDFNARQPDPNTPGGTDPGAPPVPTVPGNSLMPVIGEDGEVYFIEFDENGVPLGEWHWDDDCWIFDDFIPLGDMPATGRVYLAQPLVLLGFALICCGLYLRSHARRRPSRFVK